MFCWTIVQPFPKELRYFQWQNKCICACDRTEVVSFILKSSTDSILVEALHAISFTLFHGRITKIWFLKTGQCIVCIGKVAYQ